MKACMGNLPRINALNSVVALQSRRKVSFSRREMLPYVLIFPSNGCNATIRVRERSALGASRFAPSYILTANDGSVSNPWKRSIGDRCHCLRRSP